MNETSKKIGLIAVIVVAIIAAGFGASKFFVGEKMEVVGKSAFPPGHKSEKQQALEEQEKNNAGGGGAPAPKEERDLGG